jgi:hypothetical protein
MTTVRATTTTNGTLSTAFANGQTIDDITLVTGDYILIKDQSTATENGVYIVQSSGAPTRLQYFRTSQAISQEIVYVVEGTLYGFTQWTCTNLSGSDVVGTDNLTFTCTSIKDPINTSDTQILTNKTIDTANNTLTVAAGDITSGTLSVARGGTGAKTLTQDGILVGNGKSAVTALKSNWAASTVPSITDDSGSGYAVGSRWIDTTADKEYVCLDATVNYAVWTETTVSGATITNTELSATTTTSITSKTYVVMDTMTTTPASGTYMVTFSASGSGSSTRNIMEYSIFKANTIIQHSHRWLNRSVGFYTSGNDSALHSQAIVTVNGSQVIDVRYRTNKGTFTVEERSLILIKLS